MTTTLLQGDCRVVLATLPPASVQCCVTSPPYFGLRDYGADGQIGLEPTPDAYVQALVGVFREVRRVLRDDGTCWINLGDSYSSNGASRPQRDMSGGFCGRDQGTRGKQGYAAASGAGIARSVPPGLKPKDLIGIPWMVAFALRADGWYLRSDIIWSKPNPMPESVTDRPTKAHEYIFLLSKRERYYYDAAAIAEPLQEDSIKRNQTGWNGNQQRDYINGEQNHFSKYLGSEKAKAQTSRNRRSVWTVATQPYAGAHFATFPEKLIEPCILAGSAARACEVCGAPWARVVEREAILHRPNSDSIRGHSSSAHRAIGQAQQGSRSVAITTTGFRPTCACPNDGAARSVVLDPFVGSGTTCRVAERLGRDSIGIDLGYADLQEKRTDGVQKFMVDLL